MTGKRIKIFCDFDGTIATEDVGDLFFTTFTQGKALPAIQLWESGKIDSREMYLRGMQYLNVSKNQLNDFINARSLDTTFVPFVDFCAANDIPVSILSDGMDLYIKPILERNYLPALNVYCNELHWNGEQKLEINFPYFEHTCGRCANCKGYQIRRLRENDDFIIFVGDGYSDLCGIKEVDLIFAKDSLAAYCDREKIKYLAFENFSNILNWLKLNLTEKNTEVSMSDKADKLWQDVKKGVKDTVTYVTEKTEELTAIGRLKMDIAGIKRKTEKKYNELGRIVYDKLEKEEGLVLDADEDVKKVIEEISSFGKELKGKEKEMEEVGKKEEESTAAAEEKIEESSPETEGKKDSE